MQQIDEFKETFFQECDEQLGILEQQLSQLGQSDDEAECVNAAFRAVHSIKGAAGMFGFSRLVSFAHLLESALDGARAGQVKINKEFIDELLHATDILGDLTTAERSGDVLPVRFEAVAADQLRVNYTVLQSDGRDDDDLPEERAISKLAKYRIKYQPSRDILRSGKDPIVLIRNLAQLGHLGAQTDMSAVPPFEKLDPAAMYIGWTFELETLASHQELLEVFEFYADDCQLEIEILDGPTEEVDQGEENELSEPSEKLTPLKSSNANGQPKTSIRVELDRVERLLDLVGEITVAQGMVMQHFDASIVDSNPQLFNALSQLLQLSRDLQDGVMAIRAQPVRSIFSRMPKVVREAAADTDKQIRLETSGEETEIDKTIIEKISDPLMHIVRNAADHGIEKASVRHAQGKPEVGTIKLFATQQGGRIIVKVTDDGRGIDTEKVHQRAIDLNLIPADVSLSESEICNLIFHPGLSTADVISDISGRGVGMDVVYRNIESLGGRVSINSEINVGTTTTITLPITLAVLETMQVKCASETYLIPFNNIVECIERNENEFKTVPGSGDFIRVRDKQIPVFQLAHQLGIEKEDHRKKKEIVLVELQNEGVVGLIVEEITGHLQVVVKSISEHFRNIPGIAGASILGDGSVSFILDVDQLTSAPLAGPGNSKNFGEEQAA
ncbi:MAG: chemotaxis protein CheA [Hyphomicrobiaceae bacterium]